jgi:hypothetical protein
MLQNPHSRAYDLQKLLNQLPKEVLVEKLYNNILTTPVAEGIRAWRSLELTLDRLINDCSDPQEIEVYLEPQKNYINLMFDLHEEIEGLFELSTRDLEILEDEIANKKQELLDKAG